jgi:hypothetical protein
LEEYHRPDGLPWGLKDKLPFPWVKLLGLLRIFRAAFRTHWLGRGEIIDDISCQRRENWPAVGVAWH